MTKHDNVGLEGIMKATEFVKQHGIEKARELIKRAPSTATHFNYNSLGGHYAREGVLKMKTQWEWFNTINKEWYYDFAEYNHFELSELKRLVESHELVIVWRMPEAWSGDYDGDVNGLEGANMYLEMYGNYELVGEELERFKQAIADVEACQ
ncbi:hypothetical protein HCY58_10815 [Acinetobacter radioresistens]|uniref:hypothetical protein n=1 Tax=Acinetobacter radioresistens TaxID=40216 RepID=UPI00200626CB|nr:hypothetical protein [Acinetobacter radioresistens]MCK4087539.1 hypothetical protein [Acinetobacter radioresistens]